MEQNIVTQEFHLSVTPIRDDDYLVRTEWVASGVQLAEEVVQWPVADWLHQASQLMHDPLTGLLQGDLRSLPAGMGEALGQLDQPGPLSGGLVDLGRTLYGALFAGLVRDSWMTARAIAHNRGEVLRLRLGLKDERLPRLPWEVLYAGDRPLATGTDLLFSRYHSHFSRLHASAPFPPMPALEPGQPLRILMALAAPNDQEILALKEEAQHLQAELEQMPTQGDRAAWPPIELTLLEQPDREQLTQALEHQNFQVFHYAGHSNLGESGGNLCLVSNKTGLTETLSGEDLAGLLVNNGIWLAVFNSCRGVYTANAEGDQRNNLTSALVKRGIPAVMAMAEQIPDDVALNLSRLFYRNLRQGYPVDLSLNRARQGLLSSYGSDQLYWALPILYLHPQFDGGLTVPSAPSTPADTVLPEPSPAVAIASHADLDATLTDDLFDPVSLSHTDAATDDVEIARLVQQLSQEDPQERRDRPLTAAPDENLLPDAPPTASQDAPLPDVVTGDTAGEGDWDAAAYQELEQMLAATGKSTEAIAAFIQAIQRNPSDEQAYYRLGLALFEEGYVAESIVAYRQALKVNPLMAEAYNHLGIALTQQGHLSQAIQAFNRAVKLNPNLAEAYHNLGDALRRQRMAPHTEGIAGQPVAAGTATAVADHDTPERPHWQSPTGQTPFAQGTPAWQGLGPHGNGQAVASSPLDWWRSRPRSPWLWLGIGALSGLALLLLLWLVQGQFRDRRLPSLPTNVEQSGPLAQQPTNTVSRLATEKFAQGDVATAAQAVTALLERNATQEAIAVLTPVLSQYGEDPTVMFLMGRAQWQMIKEGSVDDKLKYSLDDVQRSWSWAAKNDPDNPLIQTALGFAAYANNDLKRAGDAWYRALDLIEKQESGDQSLSPVLQQVQLNAYAGLALVFQQSATAQVGDSQKKALEDAIRLRTQVLEADPAGFQVNALAQDWHWNEKALRDWQALLQRSLPE